MVDKIHPEFSIRRQCRILKLHRSADSYDLIDEPAASLALMRWVDGVFMELPLFGSRQINILWGEGQGVDCGQVWRMMRKIGQMSVYRRPRTIQPPP